MPRTAGAPNKPKTVADVIGEMSNEDKFLHELIAGKARWTNEASRLARESRDNTKETEYAQAYKLLINKFSEPDMIAHELKE